MFGNKPKSKSNRRIDCRIGPGTVIEGNIKFTGSLRVDGCVRGIVMANYSASGTLMLSEHAQIEGEIHVSHAIINGTVVGLVHASEQVQLQTHADVSGDLHYKSLEMQPGARMQGQLTCRNDGQATEVVRMKPGLLTEP